MNYLFTCKIDSNNVSAKVRWLPARQKLTHSEKIRNIWLHCYLRNIFFLLYHLKGLASCLRSLASGFGKLPKGMNLKAETIS